MNRVTAHKNKVQKSTLYSVVFDTVAVRYVITFLFLFFVLHPVVPALAAEDGAVESDTVEEITPEPEEEVVEDVEESVVETQEEPLEEVEEVDVVPEGTDEESEDVVSEIVDTVTEDEEEAVVVNNILIHTEEESEIPDESTLSESGNSSTEESEEVSKETVSDEDGATEDSDAKEFEITDETDLEELSVLLSGSEDDEELFGEVAGTSTTQEVATGDNQSEEDSVDTTVSGNTDESKSESTSGETSEVEEILKIETEEGVEEVLSSGEEVDEVVSVQATTTQDNATSTIQEMLPVEKDVDIIINSNNRHQFSEKDCLAVGDGSFYCSETNNAPEYIEDRVFSAPDNDGDMEIFVTISGKTTQITHNVVDDVSPQYDGISDTIVWHSMQNDRFQIAQYSVSDGVINYLTSASYNNTEPVAYGDIVMWQAWVGDNWEIMLFDNGEVTQLTDNEMHDITPQMRDGYIMWQTQFAEGWKVALFDQKTQKVSYIADSDGSGVANPRFVLVYDSTDKVGDVRTLGYDFGSGSSFTLGSLPAEMPEQLPEPDQTGETRALIQVKPTTREGETEDIQPVPTGTGTSTDATTSTSSDALVDDLVVASLDVVASSTPDVVGEGPTPEEVVDLLVAEALAELHEDVTHINDVVIPPFVATTTDEVS